MITFDSGDNPRCTQRSQRVEQHVRKATGNLRVRCIFPPQAEKKTNLTASSRLTKESEHHKFVFYRSTFNPHITLTNPVNPRWAQNNLLPANFNLGRTQKNEGRKRPGQAQNYSFSFGERSKLRRNSVGDPRLHNGYLFRNAVRQAPDNSQSCGACLFLNDETTKLPPEFFEQNTHICITGDPKRCKSLEIIPPGPEKYILEELFIKNRSLKGLPKALFTGNLQTLILQRTGLKILPQFEKAELRSTEIKITFLSVENNELTSMKRCFFTSLTILLLPGNRIPCIPKGIKHLTRLTRLDLSRNKIANIARQLFTLPKLVNIDLSWCCLKEVPEGLKQWHGTSFLLRGNPISTLPKITSTTLQELLGSENTRDRNYCVDSSSSPLCFPWGCAIPEGLPQNLSEPEKQYFKQTRNREEKSVSADSQRGFLSCSFEIKPQIVKSYHPPKAPNHKDSFTA